MATLATKVQWSSESPKIYFDFSYEKKREGSTQYYAITVSCYPLLTAESYYGYPINVQILLDGVSKASFCLKDASVRHWDSVISYATGWLGVANKTSGTTSVSIRVYSNSYSSRDVTYQYQLAVDAAASKISVVEGTAIIEGYPTIKIASASPSLTHTVQCFFGSTGDTIAEKTSATTITNWQIPERYYSQIPNDKGKRGVLQCDTYDGSKLVGTETCYIDIGTDEAKCKPSVSGTVVDVNDKTIKLTGNPNVLVRYASTAKCTMDVTLNKSAGSVSVKTINNVDVMNVADLSYDKTEQTTFDFYVKDSRGYYNSDKVACQVVPYIKLTAYATIERDHPTSGNATLRIAGNYYDGDFGEAWNNLKVECGQNGGELFPVTPTISNNQYTAIVPLVGLDYDKVYNFDIVVTDRVSKIEQPITLQKGIPVFDWGENDFSFNVNYSACNFLCKKVMEIMYFPSNK